MTIIGRQPSVRLSSIRSLAAFTPFFSKDALLDHSKCSGAANEAQHLFFVRFQLLTEFHYCSAAVSRVRVRVRVRVLFFFLMLCTVSAHWFSNLWYRG